MERWWKQARRLLRIQKKSSSSLAGKHTFLFPSTLDTADLF